MPAHALIAAASKRLDRNLVGDDERGVETDAELADQLRIVLLVARHPLEKLGRTRARDRAQVVDKLVARHTDVHYGQLSLLLVQLDANGKLVLAEQLRVTQGLEAQLVGRIGSVGNQLTKENFLVAV